MKTFVCTLKTKVPVKKILVELEILLAEYIDKDEDLKIRYEKTKRKNTKKQNR